MITVYGVNKIIGDEETADAVVLHPPTHLLLCEDAVGNQFEIETDKNTYSQVVEFLDKLKMV